MCRRGRARARRRARLRLLLLALLLLRLILLRRCAGDRQKSEVARLQDERRGYGRGCARAVAAALDDDGDGELRAVERRDAEEPTVNALFGREDDLRVLAYRVSAAVALELLDGLRLAGLRVVFGNLLLRRAGLAAGRDALRRD